MRRRGTPRGRSGALLILTLAALLLGPGASEAGAFKAFESPSQNIGCIMFEQGARCDILHHSWTPPKRPKSCEFGYGNSVFVGDRGRGVYGCVSDSALDSGTILPYGESLRKGRFICTSEEIGVRCVNRRNGHGFLLSRQQVKFF
jgi:hypothetical protein